MSDQPSVQLWHPRGVKIFIPLGLDLRDDAPEMLLHQVSKFLDAGFLANAPGLVAGEEVEEFSAVVKGFTKKGAPRIDLYVNNDAMKFSFLSLYLDGPDDIAAFEYATKLNFAAIQPYIGVGHLERGNVQTDQLIIKAPKPFGAVWTKNPDYDQAEADRLAAEKKMYPVPKRKFVRWVDQKPSGTPTPAQEPPKQGETTPRPVSQKTRDKLDQKPSMEETTKLASWWINEAKPDHAERQGSLDAIGVYANERGWVWYEGKYEPAPF
jgi:hypothetical protein